MLKMKSFSTSFLMDCLEYYSFSSTVRTKDDPIGYEQIHVLLTYEEKSLKHAYELIKDPVHMAMIGTGP